MLIKTVIKNYFETVNDDDYELNALTDGLSGAQVYILRIKKSPINERIGIYILKIIDTTSCWYNEQFNEADKTEEIYNQSEKYQDHLVKLCYRQTIDDKLIIICSYALQNELCSITLYNNDIHEKCQKLESISYELLEKFNDTYICKNGKMIQELSKYRIEETGNFTQRLSEILDNVNRPSINIDGTVIPNPMFYIKAIDEALVSKNIQLLWGKVHGDLHQKNILTLTSKRNDYVIIDYDSYNKNFLLFDQAYLELSVYDSMLDSIDIFTWLENLQYIFSENTAHEDEIIKCYYEKEVRSSIEKGICRWFNDNMPNNMDLFRIQIALARVVAGINFFSKGMIIDQNRLIKYMIYISINLKKVLEYLKIDWDKEFTTYIKRNKNENNSHEIWKAVDGFRSQYLKVLITDDEYTPKDYEKLFPLKEICWNMIVDIGKFKNGDDLYNIIGSIIKQNRNISYINEPIKLGDKLPIKDTCLWINLKQEQSEKSAKFLLRIKKQMIPILKQIQKSNPFKSFLFAIDIHLDKNVLNGIIGALYEENILSSGSRFINFGDDVDLQYMEIFPEDSIFYQKFADSNLLNISQTVIDYGFIERRGGEKIILPTIDGRDGVVESREYEYYSSSLELVYNGIEKNINNYCYGKEFYRGNEISWMDLEKDADIRPSGYDSYVNLVLNKLEKSKTPILRLGHGAGAGGTTLSRRLIWDVKDKYPSAILKSYTVDTTNIICEIYRKTGKAVFIVVEMGSTLISEEELNILITGVNAQSCRAVFMKVERMERVETNEKVDILLPKELNGDEPKHYLDVYSEYTDDSRRKENLYNITTRRYDSDWENQCCPFFYGFYTFQEEYQALPLFVKTTLKDCRAELKELLIDLSIITKYSQIICIPYEEVGYRLKCEQNKIYQIERLLGDSIRKLLVFRENGMRLCHPLIATKILETICDKEQYLYDATNGYIDRMDIMYKENGREYIDSIFRELFIDRSYIDGAQQKFSLLINDLKLENNKKNIFIKLTKLYPDNPHYYNHLGRLEVADGNQFKNYDKAISYLNRAITIAQESGLSATSHYITLACIYSKKIVNDINDQRGKEITVQKLLDLFMTDFCTASNYFNKARGLQRDSSYGYFPNIIMICNTVKSISNVKRLSVDELLKDSTFEEWYNCYAGIAIQLYYEMDRNCENISQLKSDAENMISRMEGNLEAMKKKLAIINANGIQDKGSCNFRRTVCSLIYSNNSYEWYGMKPEDIKYIESEMYKNIMSGYATSGDVLSWLNAYRELPKFDAAEAISMISDYMEDSYYKEYLLWLMFFIECEKGLSTETLVVEHLNKCRFSKDLTNSTVRTTRYIDAYTNINVGCPIKRFHTLEKDDNGELLHLKEFTGTITKINSSTMGTITMDQMNVEVFFTPSFSAGGTRREFTSKNETQKVAFNLMFTYSGLQAFNPRLI